MIMFSTLLVSQNIWEGLGQQALCYASAFLYFFMISDVVKEVYVQPTLETMFVKDWEMIVRYMFL